jgi:predicted negative regulator of RcsB-dependent stress response
MAIGKNENAISDLNMVINSTKDDDLKKKATSKLASIIK